MSVDNSHHRPLTTALPKKQESFCKFQGYFQFRVMRIELASINGGK